MKGASQIAPLGIRLPEDLKKASKPEQPLMVDQ
jgi:hypothetical protein